MPHELLTCCRRRRDPTFCVPLLSRAVKENEAIQSTDDIDDFEKRLAGGAPRRPAKKAAPVPTRKPQAPQQKGIHYVQSSKQQQQRRRGDDDDFDDAKNAMNDLDKFDALNGGSDED